MDTSPALPYTHGALELVVHLQEEAAADADRVIGFLRWLGFESSPENPLHLPPVFLLQLATTLRVLTWERLGFRGHFERGLPSGHQLLDHTFQVAPLPDPAPHAPQLEAKFGLIALAHLAWHARHLLGTTIVLDFLHEESALDALAEFLWTHRHSKPL